MKQPFRPCLCIETQLETRPQHGEGSMAKGTPRPWPATPAARCVFESLPRRGGHETRTHLGRVARPTTNPEREPSTEAQVHRPNQHHDSSIIPVLDGASCTSTAHDNDTTGALRSTPTGLGSRSLSARPRINSANSLIVSDHPGSITRFSDPAGARKCAFFDPPINAEPRRQSRPCASHGGAHVDQPQASPAVRLRAPLARPAPLGRPDAPPEPIRHHDGQRSPRPCLV